MTTPRDPAAPTTLIHEKCGVVRRDEDGGYTMFCVFSVHGQGDIESLMYQHFECPAGWYGGPGALFEHPVNVRCNRSRILMTQRSGFDI